jgi:hypothetical protein
LYEKFNRYLNSANHKKKDLPSLLDFCSLNPQEQANHENAYDVIYKICLLSFANKTLRLEIVDFHGNFGNCHFELCLGRVFICCNEFLLQPQYLDLEAEIWTANSQ